MNERLQHHDSGEKLVLGTETEKNIEHAKEKVASSKEISSDQIEQIRQSIEGKAISGNETVVGEDETKHDTYSLAAHQELKTSSYKRSLQHIQSRLHGPEKVFSKLVHKPVMEQLSNVGAQTVARPAGVMMAGVVTLLGSAVCLYLARRTGFSYNLSLFVVFFVSGYLLGLFGELIVRLVKRRR